MTDATKSEADHSNLERPLRSPAPVLEVRMPASMAEYARALVGDDPSLVAKQRDEFDFEGLPTWYVMTAAPGGCLAACAFCSQRLQADRLVNYEWPLVPFEVILRAFDHPLTRGVTRLCVQTALYSGVNEDVCRIVEATHRARPDLGISVGSLPVDEQQLRRFRELGADFLALAMDAATPELFEAVKGAGVGGPWRWANHLQCVEKALEVFGRSKVSTHLIVGLGETEREAIQFVQTFFDREVNVGLFPFLPLPGTPMQARPPCPRGSFRRVQVALDLIVRCDRRVENMAFDAAGRVVDFGVSPSFVEYRVRTGAPFFAFMSGCKGCAKHGIAEQNVAGDSNTRFMDWLYLSPLCLMRLAADPRPYASYFGWLEAYTERFLQDLAQPGA